MPRFSKGTTDHDSDGLMGGSRRGDTTMDKATKPAKVKATKPVKAPKPEPKAEAPEPVVEPTREEMQAASRLRSAARGGL